MIYSKVAFAYGLLSIEMAIFKLNLHHTGSFDKIAMIFYIQAIDFNFNFSKDKKLRRLYVTIWTNRKLNQMAFCFYLKRIEFMSNCKLWTTMLESQIFSTLFSLSDKSYEDMQKNVWHNQKMQTFFKNAITNTHAFIACNHEYKKRKQLALHKQMIPYAYYEWLNAINEEHNNMDKYSKNMQSKWNKSIQPKKKSV